MYDFVIVGGGIVGASTAWQLQRRSPEARILLLEKEDRLAGHQTSHNSGVIHAGIYYKPDSLKATFCREGVDATVAFCRDNELPYEQCGKLLVSTNEIEHQRMLALYERGVRNRLELTLLNADELKSLEPNIVGTGAIYVKSSGIVSYKLVCRKMAALFQALGGEIRLNTEVTGLQESAECIVVATAGENIRTKFLISCTGLMADRTTRMLGLPADFAVIPYRGEYLKLAERHNGIVRHLIYPIPDPALPFLGVHLTRTIAGDIIIGPNALQGWKREGYGRVNFDIADTLDLLRFAGFWRVSAAHWRTALTEMRNAMWPSIFMREVRKYCPSLQVGDLEPYPAGVRAMAVMKDGSMVEDFLFRDTPRSLHVCSAPSPAATSSIPIGSHICDMVQSKMPRQGA